MISKLLSSILGDGSVRFNQQTFRVYGSPPGFPIAGIPLNSGDLQERKSYRVQISAVTGNILFAESNN